MTMMLAVLTMGSVSAECRDTTECDETITRLVLVNDSLRDEVQFYKDLVNDLCEFILKVDVQYSSMEEERDSLQMMYDWCTEAFAASEKWLADSLSTLNDSIRVLNSLQSVSALRSGTADIRETDGDGIFIYQYPSPEAEYLCVDGRIIDRADIFSTIGVIVRTVQPVQGNMIDVHDLPPGMYIAVMDDQISYKFIKR